MWPSDAHSAGRCAVLPGWLQPSCLTARPRHTAGLVCGVQRVHTADWLLLLLLTLPSHFSQH